MNKISNILTRMAHSYQIIMKVLVFIIAIVVVIWQMPRSVKFKYEFQKMRPWQHEALYAPFNFPIYKTDEQLKQEKEEALKDFYPIYIYDTEVTGNNRVRMLVDFENQWNGKEADKLTNLNVLKMLYDTIENVGIISQSSIRDGMKPESMIDVVKDRFVRTKQIRDFYTMKTASERVSEILSEMDVKVDDVLINRLLLVYLNQNVFYSEELTNQAEEQALSAISLTFGMIQKDELIISEGEVITDEKYNILNSLRIEYDSLGADNFFNKNMNFYGQAVIVCIIFIFLFLGLKLLRPDVVNENNSLTMILVMMLLIIIPSFLVIRHYPTMIFMMPITILSMLLLTFFDAKTSIYVQTLTLLIISLAAPNAFQFFLLEFLVSMISIFILVSNTSRSRYFLTSFVIFISYIVVKLGMSLIFEGSVEGLSMQDVGRFAMNTLFTMLTLPLSFLFERFFGFVTDLTLLELSNTNSPLLIRLSSEAPGTFQHVMQVADLCEEALYKIGGNMLLARTGAMYHDIGKINNPLYFTENQVNKFNYHDDVSNIESAQIIINHVLDGIEICRKFHIPEDIIDFVRTHHGTRRTEYFYQMELRENPDGDVNEADFRYHGPIPFSKETAVLMMADSVEAASRSLKDKTEESISKLVDTIIDAQVNDNQFINTDLTFRDITMVKKVFKKKLMNIYHVRIAYPV
ncbi:MAG: HDIG domain-containing protein [Lentimicrobiaceae bacterium]|nr:HDIG domain-containing protein [Lentimicrobiaceae bacterium]